MCGIAGILGRSEGRVDAARLVRMREAMVHRGPDGAGEWHDEMRSVGLAHRRLAIVDLSDAGLQPMATPDGRLRIVYNGEIYNHLELRRELEELGWKFRSRTDTETLLYGLAQWGEAALDRLQGMFAFAAWDSERGSLLLARDRVGVKPLYFTENAGEFLFASEIKALLADPAVPREADPVAAWHFLTFVVPPAPLTLFRGVYKIPAGHVVTVRPGEAPSLRPWWSPSPEPAADVDPAVYLDDDACAAEFLRRLEAAIERRMMADVPFGVFLSGGIDSTTNVALMRRHMDRPVTTFSVGFREHTRLNELEHARRVAEHFGTDHHEVLIGQSEMREYLPDMVRQQDEPIADWVCVPLHYLAALARRTGVPVVQVGEGADEQLCGYEPFRDAVSNHLRYERTLGRLPEPVARAAAGVADALGRFDPVWRRRAELARDVAAGREMFLGGAVAFPEQEKGGIWTGPRSDPPAYPPFVPTAFAGFDSEAVVRHEAELFRRAHPSADFYPWMLHLELRLRLPELLLMRVDKMCMAESVEARVPFLDHRLVEFTMPLPFRMRARGSTTKFLLRHAVRGLVPDETVRRPKMGFAAPFREWFRESFGEQARARLIGNRTGLLNVEAIGRLMDEHRAGTADHSFRLWVLLNLVMWHEHWIERRAA